MIGVLILIALALIVLMIVTYWKIFVKAGEKGWVVFIPIYNMYIWYKIAWKGYIFFIYLAIVIVDLIMYSGGYGLGGNPTIAQLSWLLTIVTTIINILLVVKVGQAFGKSGGFIVGMVLLPIVFYPILAFGDSEYIKNKPTEEIDNDRPPFDPYQNYTD